jgi:hypothetical protein
MRKGLVAIGATVLAVLAPAGVSSATHQEGEGQGSPRDFAVGAGTSGNMRVAFAAHGGPSPADVTGHFRSGGSVLGVRPPSDDPTAFQFEGPVTCLVVGGDEARLFYPIKQAGPDQPGESTGVLIFLRDNGKPQNGQPVDEIGFVFPVLDETPSSDPSSEQDTSCVAPAITPALLPLDKGDFTIHDASETTP